MTTPTTPSYLSQRLATLGITDKDNTTTASFDCYDDFTEKPVSVFQEAKNDAIGILYVGINGMKTVTVGRKEMPYVRTRINPNNVKNGVRYITPKGAGTEIFFPPAMLNAYHGDLNVPTLFITEGEFKAFKASIHGLPCLSIQGIHNFTEATDHGKILNTELAAFIKKCGTKNVVLLLDADALEVVYEDGKDLFKRPNSFYSAVKNFRELLKPFEVDVYFSHVRPDKGGKGLDDLLVAHHGNETAILDDLAHLKPSEFFHLENVSEKALGKLLDYFKIRDVDSFFSAYREVLEDVEKFRFNNWDYTYTGEKLETLTPAALDNYARVGDRYFEKITRPNKYGEMETDLEPRQKSTIIDDYGTKAIKYVKKYKTFVSVPSHVNYQQTFGESFNTYHPLHYHPLSGEFHVTMNFLGHIFGESHLGFALDYLTLLYRKPTQTLPIICLVSKERGTGKSTFGQWVIELFGRNAVKLGNADLESDFNAFYATKVLLVVDEAAIEKRVVTESVKRLSTERGKILVNAKGINQYEVDFFGKYIFISNNETDFLKIEKGENRFAVFKVPIIQGENRDMLLELKDEIPAFMEFLATRKLTYPERGRMHFDFSVFETEHLKRVQAESLPYGQKVINQYFEEAFSMFQDEPFLQFNLSQLFDEMKIDYAITKTKLKDNLKEMGYTVERNKRYKYRSMKKSSFATDTMLRFVEPCTGDIYTFFRENFDTVGENSIENKGSNSIPF